MPPRPSSLGALLYSPETDWAEDVDNFAVRLPVIGVPELALVQESLPPEIMVQYRNDGHKHVRGGYGGEISFDLRLAGHGSSTAGAGLAKNDVEVFLGRILGVSALAAAAGTTATGGTALIPLLTAAAGFSAGGLCFFGELADGDGNGQAYPIGDHAANALTLLSALDDAPVNGAVVRAPTLIYPDETAAAIESMQFEYVTGDQHYRMRGCFPKRLVFSGLNPRQIPTVRVTLGVSFWAAASSTFPTAIAHTALPAPAVVANGSFLFQEVGNTARAKYTILDFQLTYEMGVVPLETPGGVWTNQVITGAARTADRCRFSVAVHSEAATETPVWPGKWEANLEHYALVSLAIPDAKSLAFWWPRVCLVGDRVKQMDLNGLNAMRFECEAYTGGTATSDLTNAMMVIASG